MKNFYQIVGGFFAIAAVMLIGRAILIGTAVTVVEHQVSAVQNVVHGMSEKQLAQAQEVQNRSREKIAAEKKKAAKAKEVQIAHAEQEKRLSSDECRFWWDQDKTNSTERTAKKKKEYCGEI